MRKQSSNEKRGLGKKREKEKLWLWVPPKTELETRICVQAVDFGRYPRTRREGPGGVMQGRRESHPQGVCVTKLVSLEATWGVVLLFTSEEPCRTPGKEDGTFIHQFPPCWPRVTLEGVRSFFLPGLSTVNPSVPRAKTKDR